MRAFLPSLALLAFSLAVPAASADACVAGGCPPSDQPRPYGGLDRFFCLGEYDPSSDPQEWNCPPTSSSCIEELCPVFTEVSRALWEVRDNAGFCTESFCEDPGKAACVLAASLVLCVPP